MALFKYVWIYGMLSMATYAIAGSVGEPAEAPAAGAHGPLPTPIDIKLDIAALSKMFPLPPELARLGDSGAPLELKISLGAPGKPDQLEAARDEYLRLYPHSILWDQGIDAKESIPYKAYHGNGTPDQGWPTREQWVSYGSMKRLNRGLVMKACSDNSWGVSNNSPQETEQLFDAIEHVAQLVLLDRRFILAVLLEETNGCVRMHTDYGADGVRSVGLMRSRGGMGMCNSGALGAPRHVLEPCPERQIQRMVFEGVGGLGDRHGYDGLLGMMKRAETGTGTAADFYRGAWLYNRGPEASLENLEDGSKTPGSYASNVANRLTGWVG